MPSDEHHQPRLKRCLDKSNVQVWYVGQQAINGCEKCKSSEDGTSSYWKPPWPGTIGHLAPRTKLHRTRILDRKCVGKMTNVTLALRFGAEAAGLGRATLGKQSDSTWKLFRKPSFRVRLHSGPPVRSFFLRETS